jgi:hypothetical protein
VPKSIARIWVKLLSSCRIAILNSKFQSAICFESHKYVLEMEDQLKLNQICFNRGIGTAQGILIQSF